VDPATLAAALADWNAYYRPRSAAARQLTANCARAGVILKRCGTFLDDHINAQVREVVSDWEKLPQQERDQADLQEAIGRAQLPRDKTVSLQYLRCHGKWLPIFLHCSDILPLVLEFDAWTACAAQAATVAEPEAPDSTLTSAAVERDPARAPAGDNVPAEPGCPLPVPADLPVARPGDRPTYNAVCQEGPSEGKTESLVLSELPVPSAGLGFDEPGSGNLADPGAVVALAPYIRPRLYDPRPPPDRTVCDAA
jgi:hypothetical protein